MRHVYLTLQDCLILDQLLEGDEGAVRPPFRVLLRESAVSELLDLGAASGTWHYYGRRDESLGSRLPFVPGLGAIRIKPKAQVEHRAIGHDYGHSCFPPRSLSASPTGVRLAPRTEELLSHWRLADTYVSPRSRELTQRIATEGTTDFYFSDDESTWHFAFSVEPKARITVTPLSGEAERLLIGAEINPSAYIHIYPYGGVSITVAFSLVFEKDRDLSEVIPLIKALIGRRDQPQMQLAMRGAKTGVASAFIQDLGARVATAIVGEPPKYHRVDPRYAVSLAADPDVFSDEELAGLLTLDDHYAGIRKHWVEARASLYGKYSGDRVMGSRASLAVLTSPRQFPPSGRRRFFWRCHAIKEFATFQARVLGRINWQLREAATASGPSEEGLRRLIAIGEHLCEFHRGLPAHHRKWFYECQSLVGGSGAKEQFYGVLAELHGEWQRAAMMRKMEQSGGVHFEISDSQIGTLNLGTIVGDVESKLTILDANDAAEIRTGLTRLTQAALREDELDEDAKRELIESISVLADEANRKPDERRKSVVHSVTQAIAAIASTATGISVIWAEIEPLLHLFFK
jgi:hypothetical protein